VDASDPRGFALVLSDVVLRGREHREALGSGPVRKSESSKPWKMFRQMLSPA